jgi:omega-amidase
MTAQLRVGCWAFTASAEVASNAAEIRRGIAAAAAAGVRVLLTPECALTGYPGAVRADFTDLNVCALAEHEERLLAEAERVGVVLILGTASPTGSPPGKGSWTNEAVALTARYRKRCLTPGDTACFTAGSEPAVLTVDGWRLGLAICYDLRFPDVWSDLARLAVDANLVLAHMAGSDLEPGTKAAVIPAFCAVRAAETATPLVLANTAAADRWLDSATWDARGVQGARAASGLLVIELARRTDYAPWYGGLRSTYLQRDLQRDLQRAR